MSLPVTLLLVAISMACSVLTLRVFRSLNGNDGFWGLLLGFACAVTASLVYDFHNPNSLPAIGVGVITAIIATPVFAAVTHFVSGLKKR